METAHSPVRTSDHGGDDADRLLLESIRHGDAAALDALLSRYWMPLVTYAARILGSWDGAEDVAQETFIRIWNRRDVWRSDGSVQALLYRIVHNAALDIRKREERGARATRAGIDFRPPTTPFEHVQAAQLETDLDRALADLAPRRREVFLLARSHGLSNTEIADVMGIAKQTVANQLCAAVAELRERLRHYLDPHASVPTASPTSHVK